MLTDVVAVVWPVMARPDLGFGETQGLVLMRYKTMLHVRIGREAAATMPGPPEAINPLTAFWSAFGIASFAGLAALLRSGKAITPLSIFSAMLNAGLIGTAICLLWYTKFRSEDNIYFLIGVCALAGLGGTTVLDFVIQLCKKGGVSITISPSHDEELPEGQKKDD